VAILLAVVAAIAATVVLRPGGGMVEPTAVEPTAYFSAAQLERAADFRGVQRLLGLAGLLLTAAVLALIALRPPRLVRRAIERAAERPLLGGAAVGAGLAITVTVAGLPLAAWRHERAVDVGLSTRSIGPWLGDVALGAGIGAIYAAIGGIAVVALLRRFPRRWWMPASGLVVGTAVVLLYLQPVVIDPLFNEFEPLPRGDLRADVLDLAERAGVDVGEVYRVDASRRTTGVNAYVGGIGHTKRVVLYDNLIEDLPPRQVRSVVAHELGHVAHRDLWRGLLWIAIVAAPAMLLVQRLAERFAGLPSNGSAPRGPTFLPAVALAFALVGFTVGCASNVLSREVERSADSFALELTDDSQAFIQLARGLAIRNVSEPDPPALFHTLFGTHPTAIERIGHGAAYGRER
jgi:STE24 endopeptidase